MLNKENLKDIYPLSPMQADMLFHALLDSKSDAYFEQTTFRIDGQFDGARWQHCWQLLVQRHDILRTVFSYKKTEQPLQIVLKRSEPEFLQFDLRTFDPATQVAKINEYKQQDRRRGFDLSKDRLTRIALFQFQSQQFMMVWSFPHILLDGWCNGIIADELLSLWQQLQQGKTPYLPPAPSYSRYIQWLAKQDKAAATEYWREYVKGYAQLTGIPREKISTPATTEVVEYQLHFEPSLYQQLQQVASTKHVTLNILIQAMWSILLSVYNGVNDVVFGATVSGRPSSIPDIERMLGLFINTLPVRTTFEPNATLDNIIQQVHQRASQTYDFFPLAEIRTLTQLKQNLFDHLLIFENLPNQDTEVSEQRLGFSIVQEEMYEHTHYDFVLSVFPNENLTFKLTYQPRAYSAAQISRIAAHCEHLLKQFATDTAIQLKDLNILPPSEKELLLQQFNPTVNAPIAETTLVAQFEAQVARTPDQVAIHCGQQHLSYRELNQQANRVAHYLRQHYEIQADDRVALLLDRSLDLVVALWGILKSGAAYVPLDPTYPAPRIQYVLEHSQAKLVLTQAHLLHLCENQTVLPLATVLEQDDFTENLPLLAAPHHLAYVIYTSGSTGLPKGVMLMQRNVVSFCNNLSTRFGFTARDTLYAVTTVTFDISVLELIGSLLLGMQVVVAEEETLREPRQLVQELKKCSILQTTPSRLQMIIDSEGLAALAHLRVILVGGEALSQSLFEQLSRLPQTQVFNVYGPTETAIWSTTKLLDGQHLTIGNPLEHEVVYILSDNLQLLPLGVIGEVCIGGAGVSRGYWRDEPKTQLQFVPNPFRPGENLYKTGDLGRWLSNGEIEFLGRKDFQVKVRGFRIELGEIEHRLVQIPHIRQAVVTAQQGNLVAYLVVDEPMQATDLKKYLSEWLPDYMIPTHFITVENLPLTPNGKIDRKALSTLENTATTSAESIAPRTELERQLAEIWRVVLGVATVGIRDNFFELGGHSLKAVQLMTKIRQQCQREISLTQFFQQPTIEGLTQQWTATPGISRLNPELIEPKQTVICVPPIVGYGVVFQPLSDHLPHTACYALDYVENVPNLLDHYLQLLRALRLDNYILLGFSAGGRVALKLAELLSEQGMHVGAVILLDSPRELLDAQQFETEHEIYFEQELQAFESLGNRAEIKQRMYEYGKFALTALHLKRIATNIYYIQAVGSDKISWQDATLGKCLGYQGFGEHVAMLHPPVVSQNAQLIQQILDSLVTP